MATTTNYSWSTPDNTSYVKDGAQSIRTLGSSVDTTLYTALGGAYPGLRLVKKQTIGSAVSSVTVTGAFSATYENYKILISGGVGSQTSSLHLQLGATTTAYKWGSNLSAFTGGAPTSYSSSTGGAKFLDCGSLSTAVLTFNMDLLNPFASKQTNAIASYPYTSGGFVSWGGTQESNTSFTDFTLTTGAGTITGGTIYVYGYGAS